LWNEVSDRRDLRNSTIIIFLKGKRGSECNDRKSIDPNPSRRKIDVQKPKKQKGKKQRVFTTEAEVLRKKTKFRS